MSSTDESSSSSSSGRASPGLPLPPLTTQQVLIAAAATAPVLSVEQRQLLAGAAPALDQLASVINEVGWHVHAHNVLCAMGVTELLMCCHCDL
jgi:hypothetical protein